MSLLLVGLGSVGVFKDMQLVWGCELLVETRFLQTFAATMPTSGRAY